MTGHIGFYSSYNALDQEDYYEVSVSIPQTISFSASPESDLDIILSLYAYNENDVWTLLTDCTLCGGKGERDSLTYNVSVAGIYYLKVGYSFFDYGSYTLRAHSESSSGNETSTLNGKVTNALDGLPISGALVEIEGLTTTTDANGNYEIADIPEAVLTAAFSGTPISGTAPLEVSFIDQSADAAHTLVVSATGFSTYTNNQVVISSGQTLTMDVSLSPTLATGEMRIVLNWGVSPSDLDSYLKTPLINGTDYTVYYSNKGSASSAPYATLDHDEQYSYGPETITIYQKFEGTYKYYVTQFSSSGTLINSNAVVQIYTDAGLVRTVNIPATGTGIYWNVLTIDGATGNITVINEIISAAPVALPPMPAKSLEGGKSALSETANQAITSWSWAFGDGETSTAQNPTHTYTSAGDYTVALTVSNGTDSETETKTDYISVTSGTSGTIVSTTTGGLWSETATWIGGVVPTATDDVIIDGPVETYYSSCKNLTINEAKLLTCNVNAVTIQVGGDILNNGTIQDNDWMSLFIEVKGNITNNGVWSNYQTAMDATTDQTISGTSPYSGQGFTMSVDDPFVSNGQKLIAGSDVSFDGVHIYFGNSEFIIDSEKTVSFFNTADDGSGITDKMHFSGGGTVNADSTFMFGGSSSFKNMTLTGVIDAAGIIIKENVELLGTLTTSINGGDVNIEEDFTNDGIIRDGSYGENLDILVFKNITNNGFWENYQITMDGTTDQTFTNTDYLYSQFGLNSNVTSATTWQWYKNGVAIDYSATTENYYIYKQASFEEYDAYGEYYCQTDVGNSRTITIIDNSGGSSEGDVILAENFDGSTFPPTGWTQTITNSAYTWSQGNLSNNLFTDVDPTNVYSAMCGYVAEDQDEWLVSPEFSLSDGLFTLEFYAGHSTDWLLYATLKLNISVDGGTNWTKIWEASDDGGGWLWRKINLDLSTYANNTNVMLGWQYVGNDGDWVGIDNVSLIQGATGIGELSIDEADFKVLNYPNPFSLQTTISLQLEKTSDIELIIYNSLGQKVERVFQGQLNSGKHQFHFDAQGLKSGVYYYRFIVNGLSITKPMLFER